MNLNFLNFKTCSTEIDSSKTNSIDVKRDKAVSGGWF